MATRVRVRQTVQVVAALVLAAQAITAQERSEEYEEGYSDGWRDAGCEMFEIFAPMLSMLILLDFGTDPDAAAELTAIADECGIAWPVARPVPDRERTPEPANVARCQRLAALIAPLDAEIDDLLAAPSDVETGLDLVQARGRRSDIEQEMRRAGC